MTFSLSKEEAQRLDELKNSFRVIVNKRWGRSLDERAEMFWGITHQFELFAQGLKIRHGLKALPTVVQIKEFLTDPDNGAPKFIEIAMRPRPEEERLPFTPSEVVKRRCSDTADRILHCALYQQELT